MDYSRISIVRGRRGSFDMPANLVSSMVCTVLGGLQRNPHVAWPAWEFWHAYDFGYFPWGVQCLVDYSRIPILRGLCVSVGMPTTLAIFRGVYSA